jgi:hypothetical protein
MFQAVAPLVDYLFAIADQPSMGSAYDLHTSDVWVGEAQQAHTAIEDRMYRAADHGAGLHPALTGGLMNFLLSVAVPLSLDHHVHALRSFANTLLPAASSTGAGAGAGAGSFSAFSAAPSATGTGSLPTATALRAALRALFATSARVFDFHTALCTSGLSGLLALAPALAPVPQHRGPPGHAAATAAPPTAASAAASGSSSTLYPVLLPEHLPPIADALQRLAWAVRARIALVSTVLRVDDQTALDMLPTPGLPHALFVANTTWGVGQQEWRAVMALHAGLMSMEDSATAQLTILLR